MAAACRDDCITNMSEKGKKWFEDMGSLEIKELGYRQGFAFIGQFGKQVCVERKAKYYKDKVFAAEIFEVVVDVEAIKQAVKDSFKIDPDHALYNENNINQLE